MKTLYARTEEIDEPQAAVAGIMAQLDLEHRALKNSIGLVSCYAEFIGSGVVAALAGALPFPIAGTTTIAAASNTGEGELSLFLTVLTADDVEFVVGVTDPISGEDEAPFRRAWEETGGKRPGKPALMLSFVPLIMNVAADFYAEAWTSITGGVPNFGSLAVDHNEDYHQSQTILGTGAWRDRYVFILCYGNLEPQFFIGGISEEMAFREKGVVTSSQGNILKEVNGRSVSDYLTSLGLSKDAQGNLEGINSYPFILDFNDGTEPIIRVMFAVTPDGSAVCGGKIPAGATLTVGTISGDEVLRTSTEVLKTALKAAGGRAVLIFSCIGRYFAQGFNTTAEMDRAREILGENPFSLVYAGGELCPVHGKDGGLTNRSHNDTMVICIL
jgi:hypothetical protein